MAFLDKNAIFRHNIELEAIARQSVEASREVICAYFGNIDRNSGYFLLRIFLSSHPNVYCMQCMSMCPRCMLREVLNMVSGAHVQQVRGHSSGNSPHTAASTSSSTI